jgi:hypothetical protein
MKIRVRTKLQMSIKLLSAAFTSTFGPENMLPVRPNPTQRNRYAPVKIAEVRPYSEAGIHLLMKRFWDCQKIVVLSA